MKLKFSLFSLLLLFYLDTFPQENKFDLILGHNTAFRKSILSELPSSIYTYNKNNSGGHDLITIPNFNIGLNYERILSFKFSLFTGIHSARTETELIFQNFYNTVDNGSYVKYGYSVNTYEIPIGIIISFPVSNKIIIKNYFALTINFNGLSQGVYKYRLSQSSLSDTTHLRFTDIQGFPSGNSLGLRYGIGILPFQKYRNWEIGAYINLQFKRSLTWEQEVEFENISQNTYEYHHAILKDKPDYINFHLKYTFLKF